MAVKLPCQTMDPDLHFPVGTTGPALAQTELAKLNCDRCPVREACLDWAIRNGVEFGIWGGHTPEERRAIQRRPTNAQPHLRRHQLQRAMASA